MISNFLQALNGFQLKGEQLVGKYWDQIFTGLQLKYVSVSSLKSCNSRHSVRKKETI